MKEETRQAIEDAKEAYDENMGFIRCIKSDPRNIIHDAYEHALTLAIEEIEEKDKIITILRGELDFKDPNDYIEYFLPKKEASK